MGYIEFGILEDRFYQARQEEAYRGVYGSPESDMEQQTEFAIDWESESEACEDMTTVKADTVEEAEEIFREEMIGKDIPEDAVITAVREWYSRTA